MKPHPTKSKPRKAKKKPYVPIQLDGCEQRLADAVYQNELKRRGYKPKPSPRQPVKGARVMWQHNNPQVAQQTIVIPRKAHGWDKPVLVLDLSPEARERRVEAGAKAISDSKFKPGIFVHLTSELKDEYREYARAVLALTEHSGKPQP